MDAFTDADINDQLSQYSASSQKEITGLLEKNIFNIVTPKEFVTSKEVITSEEVLSITQVFDSGFIDKIKNPGTYKTYRKSHLVVQVDNNKDKNFELI